MQRVRIGLTGLAFVFLAVLLAAIFTGQTPGRGAGQPNCAEPAGPGVAAQAPPEEPLATLGPDPEQSQFAPPLRRRARRPAGRGAERGPRSHEFTDLSTGARAALTRRGTATNQEQPL